MIKSEKRQATEEAPLCGETLNGKEKAGDTVTQRRRGGNRERGGERHLEARSKKSFSKAGRENDERKNREENDRRRFECVRLCWKGPPAAKPASPKPLALESR